MNVPVLALRDVSVRGGDRRLLGPIDLTLQAGECVGLVGESGSGKSLTIAALLGLLPAGLQASGALHLAPLPAGAPSGAVAIGSPAHAALRGRTIAWMPQDALASLHPLRTVGAQLIESLRRLRGVGAAEARELARASFARLRLPDPDRLLARRPHELSGGQRQRALLAIALAGAPRVLLADEPTSALDPALADEVLAQLDELRREGLAVLLVSHDLPRVAAHARRVAILHAGEIVERGDAASVFAAPAHPRTQALVAADRLPVPERHAPGPRLLQVEDLRLTYPRAASPALQGATLDLHRGECLAVVGESGSGKSSLGRAVLRLVRHGVEGRVRLDGEDLLTAGRGRLRALRRRIGVVFQDPYASLDPRMRLDDLVAEPLRIHGDGDRARRRARAVALLASVGLDPSLAGRRPHQVSGGQAQRVAIARALATDPDLLVCDEAVSALDAHHRAAVLALLGRLKRERGLALLFVTHDPAAARALAERTARLADGRIVACGDTAQVLSGTPAVR